jgi:DNA polymerase I-like protein with 3'-5' exonuclease and polymerase domains
LSVPDAENVCFVTSRRIGNSIRTCARVGEPGRERAAARTAFRRLVRFRYDENDRQARYRMTQRNGKNTPIQGTSATSSNAPPWGKLGGMSERDQAKVVNIIHDEIVSKLMRMKRRTVAEKVERVMLLRVRSI